jgi:putative phosphoribosyl transferase
MKQSKLFINRVDAGKKLSSALASTKSQNAIVLAIPRGGVIVGYEIARTRDIPLDVIIPRKLGAPSNPELAIGAVAEDGTLILNEELVSYLGVTEEYIKAESAKAALASVRKRGAKTVVMAVPVGPASTIVEMQNDADQVVCLYTPDPFYAIGQFYENFAQTTDEEVIKLLKLSHHESKL